MLYAHERNIKNKIKTNYNGKSVELTDFYNNEYLPMRAQVEALIFDESDKNAFIQATQIFNEYYDKIKAFSTTYGISSQSKFDSTFLEEISVYLFKNLPDIVSGALDFFNKGVYAGLKINKNKDIEIIKKDVDFCIGKKVKVEIENQKEVGIILPVVTVEVKTYLDSTMFGEVKSSSRAIKSASPNCRTYILMGYKDLKDNHIIAARQDSALNEIFVLRANKNSLMDSDTIFEYWKEISSAIAELASDKNDKIVVPGRILNP